MENKKFLETQSEPENIFPEILPVFLLIGVTFILIMVVGGISMLFLGKTAVFLSEVIIILPALLFVIVARAPITKVFRLKVPSSKILISSFLVAVGLFVLVDQLDRLIQAIFPMPGIFVKSMEEMLTIHSFSDGVVIIFSAVLIAGLCEEMLFRGLFQGTLEVRLNVPIAVWMSAAVFALIHLMPWTILQILILGLVLSFMALQTKSILPCAIVHGCNNLFSIVLLNLGEEKTQWYASSNFVNPYLLIGAVALVFIGLRPFMQSENQ